MSTAKEKQIPAGGNVSGKKKIFDGRYEILSIVGRGACSVVYHALHIQKNSQDVALKVLVAPKGDKQITEALRKEALAMVSSRHKYIIRLDDFHYIGELAYLAMEYAALSDLRVFAGKKGGKLSPVQCELFLTQICDALHSTHLCGIIHRDIKPDNILIVDDTTAKLGDFGLAVMPGEKASLDELQKGVGTMSYMAPEVIEGKFYDRRSDIYALGVSFYEILTGVHPFESLPLYKQLDARRGGFPDPKSLVPEIPQYLSDVIMAALRFDAGSRFQTVREMGEALINKALPEPKTESKDPLPAPEAKVLAPAEPAHSIPQPANLNSEPKRSNFVLGTTVSQDSSDQAEENKSAPDGMRQVPVKSSPAIGEDSNQSRTVLFRKQDVDQVKKEISEPVPQAKPEPRKSASVRAATSKKEPVAVNAPAAKKSPFSRFASALLIAIVLGVLFARFFYRQEISSRMGLSSGNSSASISEGSLLPSFAGGELVFPRLPAGTYFGNLLNFLNTQSVPMLLVSVPNSSRLILLLGYPGFAPAEIDLEETGAKSDDLIRFKSNGFIFEMSAAAENGELVGVYREIMTGSEGEWKLTPLVK